MHIMAMFDHSCLKAFHLGGREKTLMISRVSKAEVTNGTSKSVKPLLHFEGHKLPLVFGKTVAKTLIAMYGTDTSAWVGKWVTIYGTTCQGAGGGMVEAIRVRPMVPCAPVADSPALPAGGAPDVHDAEFEEAERAPVR